MTKKLMNSNVMLIRHAEDPEVLQPSAEETQKHLAKIRRRADEPDVGLSAVGRARALAYVPYFENLQLSPSRKHSAQRFDFLFAAANTHHSHRAVQTLKPLERVGLKIDDHFHAGSKGFPAEHYELADHLLDSPRFSGKNILICWHHTHLLELANRLCGDPPHRPQRPYWPKRWPAGIYGWLLWISYDGDGQPTERCYR